MQHLPGCGRLAPLAWSGVPANARRLVLVIDDPEAPNPTAPRMRWVHWVLYNIPATAPGFPVGVTASALPAGTLEGSNDFHRTTYGGPAHARPSAVIAIFTSSTPSTPCCLIFPSYPVQCMWTYIVERERPARALLRGVPPDWLTKRNNLYGRLGLPQDPQEFLGPVLAHLDQRLELLDRAAEEGNVRIDTAVHLDALEAQPGDIEADRLRRAIFDARPPGQLPEIILEIDSATRFSWILLGREPRSRIELRMMYSAVLAHGTSLSAAEISRMVPEISPAAIRQMMKRLEDDGIDLHRREYRE